MAYDSQPDRKVFPQDLFLETTYKFEKNGVYESLDVMFQ
jgi:hypothetical protein